jgi:hypothetical protein
MTQISKEDLQELIKAKHLLENPGLAARISDLLSVPITKLLGILPDRANTVIGEITKSALDKAADVAIFTMKDVPEEDKSNFMHKIAVAATGGIGGFFGEVGLALELPISTTIMLRSILDIARSEGERVKEAETKIACLEVFALGSNRNSDDETEIGYYTVRGILSKNVKDAVKFLATNTADKSAPILVKFISKIAERFGIAVTEKAMAQAMPFIGTAGGAIINTIFIDHFQNMAKGHFTVRRLERKYNADFIKQEYEKFDLSIMINNK